jgi:putative toxin-antitoxin system antitoxin component (TIGR02293 family)
MKPAPKKKSEKPPRQYSGGAKEKLATSIVQEPAVAYITTSTLSPIIRYLGGKQALRGAKTPESDYEYMALINAGLPKLSFDHLLHITGLPLTEMADIFNLTDRTLRRYHPDTILNREQSERAVELAQLYSRGAEVLGSLEYFQEWVNSPIPALGGKKPKACLGTSLGIRLLTKILGRVEYGVYS